MLHIIIEKLCKFEVLKLGQNLHANMEGFCRAGHIYITAFLIQWPERDALRLTMPMSFRRFFKACCVIIDCTEIFIEQPTDLLARAQV